MDEQSRASFLGWTQLPRFKKRVEEAKRTINEALAIAPSYVAVSWGKDSTVLLHLCQQIDPNIKAISLGNPDRSFCGYEQVISDYCDRFPTNLETIEIEGDHVPDKLKQLRLWERYPMAIVGVRKEESQYRSMAISRYGLIYQFTNGEKEGSWRCFPLGYWGWQDVWGYIVQHDLPYLSAYDRQSWERGRTTDHLSKSTKKRWQRTRLEGLASIAPEYYQYLLKQYPEMFN